MISIFVYVCACAVYTLLSVARGSEKNVLDPLR